MKIKNLLAIALFTTLTPSLLIQSVFAQQDIAEDLKPALAKITESSVTSTVTFLSSDEMKGRDTPSPELQIASAYVASRFRGAGLTGIGDDGSYFQTNEIATVVIPTSGLTVEKDGTPLETFGMLTADSEPLAYEGNITMITGETPKDATFTGPVSIVADPFDSRRDQSNLFRSLARLRQNGATAILVQVDPDHRLVSRASGGSSPRMINPRGGASGHVVLIAKQNLEGAIKLNLPRQIGGKAKVHNVIGMVPGSDPELSKEAIIITAHLDHIGTTTGVGDTINNGADDNATGVTGVLSLADAYAALPTAPKRTVIFMTFWGEEKGLLGSRYYVNNPIWPLEKTVANVNLEMIGRPEAGASGKCWGTGWDKSDLGDLMSVGAKKVGVLIFQHPQFSGDMLYRSSDNAPFNDKKVIAHSFSAGSMHPDYHKPGDEWEKLEIKHMTLVIKGLFAGTLPIANGKVTPKKSE